MSISDVMAVLTVLVGVFLTVLATACLTCTGNVDVERPADETPEYWEDPEIMAEKEAKSNSLSFLSDNANVLMPSAMLAMLIIYVFAWKHNRGKNELCNNT